MPNQITQAIHFTGDSLSDDDRVQASRISRTLTGAIVKGLFHRLDPTAFALDGNVAGIEIRAAVAIQQIAAPAFERMKPKITQLRGNTSRIKELTGLTVDSLRSPGAIQMAAVGGPPSIHPPQPDLAAPTPRQPPKYKRLDLNLRKLHCVDETNPESGTDDMVLGAMRIGASGNVAYTSAIVAGEYDDGTMRSFGELQFGSVSLRSTQTWPKTFYWIFHLVESDSDDAEVAAGLTTGLSLIAATVGGYFGGPAVAALVKGIVDALGYIVGLFIDDDTFPPYGIVIKLNSENDFGSDGILDQHTGNISAHGGVYRIGYRLRLA